MKMRKKSNTDNGKGLIHVFFKTFFIWFAILLTLSMGVSFGIKKVMNYRPLAKENKGKPVAVLEEELNFEELIPTNSPFFKEFRDSKRVNILLLGVNPPLTDVIMVASFDVDNSELDVISIPRDTYYQRDTEINSPENKINAAYKGNPINSARAASKILRGMPINYYAVIKYDGVSNIVDSMGGVPITIPDVQGKGGMYYNDPNDTPPLKIALPAGERVLTGKEAVQFLRFRHGYKMADLDRVKAHHEFIKSAMKQCLSKDLPKIARTTFENVDSDIKLGVTLGLAKKARKLDSDKISMYTIPYTLQNEPPWYVYPDETKIEEMIREIYIGKEENVEDTSQEGESKNSSN